MGDTEKGNIDLMRMLQTPPFGPSSSSSSLHKHQLLPNNHLDVSQLNLSRIQGSIRQNLHTLPGFASENIRRVAGFPPSHPQMPPISPYSQTPVNRPAGQQIGLHSFGHGPSHSRSLSQPPIFNFDSLPHMGVSAYKEVTASPENRGGGLNSMFSSLPPSLVGSGSDPLFASNEGLPPRKLHRRCISDVPSGLGNGLFQSPPLPPGGGGLQRTFSGGTANPPQLVKQETFWEGDGNYVERGMEEKKPDVEAMDELVAAYMNLDNMDLLNNGDENQEEMDSRASNSKVSGGDNSENDAESSVNESGCSGKGGMGKGSPGERKESLKRSAGGDIVHTIRHQRSISMDSFMGKLQICDDSSNLPPGAGALAAQFLAGESSKVLSLELRRGEFSGAELEKIMANEKLADIAKIDPKRAKRILANRQSAARSKERKMRYISELEHKVQTLQNEATTLSTQLTMLQKDAEGLTTLNKELKFRLQAMEQQAQLHNALNEALTKEIQRLRITAGETRSTEPFVFVNSQMFQQQLPTSEPQKPPKGPEPSNSTNKSE